MKSFLATKRKLIELGLLIGFNLVILFLWQKLEAVMLFSLGYIWNWTASQDLLTFYEGRKYRFSLLKMVFNLQYLFLIPFRRLPAFLQILPKSLPAGLFWLLVIVFIDSKMPWWATFVGSFIFELTQFEKYFTKYRKDSLG